MNYSASRLNQYTQRTVPGYAALRGEAATNATVTVNERPTFRQGTYFFGGDEADNTTSNLWKELEVYAAINPPGTNTPDTVYASTGTVCIARTPETFTYDADGNMTSDGRFHYFWNGENRLVMASNDTVIVTYAYDHRGRMVRKEISRGGAEARRIEYLWDDWNIIRETLTTNHYSLTTDYVWGLDLVGTLQGAGGVGGLLAVVRSNSNSNSALYFPTYDANGNISEYVSTNGEIVAHYDYSPFGEPLVAVGDLAATFTHQFSTKPYDTILQISSYELRHYSSVIGKFMTRDPIYELGSWNIYNMVKNNPVSDFDVLALKSYVTDDGITFIDTGYVNCAGGALGDGYYIEPAEGHSWKEVAESRGFTDYKEVKSSKECDEYCGRCRNAVVMYVPDYVKGKDPFTDPYQKEAPSEQGSIDPKNPNGGRVYDVHFVLRKHYCHHRARDFPWWHIKEAQVLNPGFGPDVFYRYVSDLNDKQKPINPDDYARERYGVTSFNKIVCMCSEEEK